MRILGRLCCVAFSFLWAPSAHAAPGVNLRWLDCFGDGGVVNRYFACNTNAGVETLVGSFEIGSEMPQVSGLEIVIDVYSAASPLPAWWQFKNAGSCRTNALSIATTPPTSATVCLDWSSGQATGVLGAYTSGLLGPHTARVLAALAVPPSSLASLITGQEYFGFMLRIQHIRTVGTGACEGCCTRASVVFNRIKVTGPIPQDDRTIAGPSNGTESHLAMWQGGNGFFSASGSMLPPPACGETVPTRSRTWSEVKALYR